MRGLKKKVMLPIGILSAAIVAACVNFQMNRNVYSTNIYASGTYYVHDWRVGPSGCQCGLSEYGQYKDAHGLVIVDAGHEKERGGVYHRFTRVRSGPLSFVVPLPALAVAAIGTAAILGAGGLLISILLWMRKPNHDERVIAPTS